MSNYFNLVHMGGRGEKQHRYSLTGIDVIFSFPERGGFRVCMKGVNEKCLLANPDLKPKAGNYYFQNLCATMYGCYKVFKTNTEIIINTLFQEKFNL